MTRSNKQLVIVGLSVSSVMACIVGVLFRFPPPPSSEPLPALYHTPAMSLPVETPCKTFTGNGINFTTAPASGAAIVLARVTPLDQLSATDGP